LGVFLWARYPCNPPRLGLEQDQRCSRKVDVRLPGKGSSNSHGARPVQTIITMIQWIRTSRLSIQNSLIGRLNEPCSCRANLEHISQSRPDSGLGFQVKVLKSFRSFPLRSAAECKTRTERLFEPKNQAVLTASVLTRNQQKTPLPTILQSYNTGAPRP